MIKERNFRKYIWRLDIADIWLHVKTKEWCHKTQGVVSQDSRSGVKDSRSWIQGFKELDSRTEGVADCTVVS